MINKSALLAFLVVLGGGSVATVAPYSIAVLPDDPAPHRQLTEAAGIRISRDANTELGTPGIPGLAGSKISVPYGGTLNTPAFSIEAWMNPVQPGVVVTGERRGAFLDGYWLFTEGDASNGHSFSLVLGGIDGQTRLGSGLMESADWYHLVGTFDGTDARLFVNGVETAIAPVELTAIYRPIGSSLTTTLSAAFEPGVYPCETDSACNPLAAGVSDEIAF